MHETVVIKLKQAAQAHADVQDAREQLARAQEVLKDAERGLQSHPFEGPVTVPLEDGRVCTVTRQSYDEYDYLVSRLAGSA